MPPYPPNNIAPAGVYTFDILVQGASPYDCDRMRSSSLKIAGHEVNQPTEESTKYEIKYLLNDTKKASQAEVKLYDIDLGNLSSLQGTTEISPTWNTIYLEESAVDMSKGGPYIFLFSAMDDHPETDKAHRQKPALEVNDRKHIHKWKEEHNITPPIITIDKEYVRASNEEKDRIVKITIPKKEDEDKCVVTNPPCSFPNGIAKNVLKVIDGSDNGAGGKFGELDENGNFVPWDSWKEIELRDDYTYIYYRCPDKPGVISLTFKFDDIPKANDPEKPQRLNPIDTFDDNPATSDPVKLTVWDFTITDCPSDWMPEFSKALSFHLQIKPEKDHKGNSLASQIICWLFSSDEPQVCKNMRLVDLTGNPDASWQYYWDLQFGWYQSNFDIFSSNVNEWNPPGPNNPPKRDIAISKQTVTDTMLYATCYDYGAFGLLVAFAQIPYVGESSAGNPDLSWPRGVVPSGVELPSGVIFARVVKIENGEVIPKYRSDGSPKFEVVIPIDENTNDKSRNYIADAWQYDKKGLQATDDNDDQPSSATKGDGLSAYDEYRGFFVKTGSKSNEGKHQRLNPNEKDIFIFDQTSLSDDTYDDFKTLALVNHFWDFQKAQNTGDGKVTIYDYTAHTRDQYGIWVHIQGGLFEGGYTPEGRPVYMLGSCSNLLSGSQGVSVIIYRDAIRYYSAPHVGYNPADSSEPTGYLSPPYRIQTPDYANIEDPVDKEVMRSVLAHELGHALISLEHFSNQDCIMYSPLYFDHINHFYCSTCKNKIKLR